MSRAKYQEFSDEFLSTMMRISRSAGERSYTKGNKVKLLRDGRLVMKLSQSNYYVEIPLPKGETSWT